MDSSPSNMQWAVQIWDCLDMAIEGPGCPLMFPSNCNCPCREVVHLDIICCSTLATECGRGLSGKLERETENNF